MSDQLHLQLWRKGRILVSNSMQYFTVKLLRILVEKIIQTGMLSANQKTINGVQIYVCCVTL